MVVRPGFSEGGRRPYRSFLRVSHGLVLDDEARPPDAPTGVALLQGRAFQFTGNASQFIGIAAARLGESRSNPAMQSWNWLSSRRIAHVRTGMPDRAPSVFNIDSSRQAATSSIP